MTTMTTTHDSRTTTAASPTTCPASSSASDGRWAAAACSGSSAVSARSPWSGCGDDDATTEHRHARLRPPLRADGRPGRCPAGAHRPAADGRRLSVEVADGEIPEETAGPYPGDGSNGPNVLSEAASCAATSPPASASASGVAEGVPMTVKLRVYDLNGDDVTPLAGAAVYLWHCDREGRYSMYSEGVTDENYLRGVQEADADGAEFTTIFPACYAGRWPHMHFEVYESLDNATSAANKLRTSQLAIPEDVCEQVYGDVDGYEESVDNLAQRLPRHRRGVQRRLLAPAGRGHRVGRRGLHRLAQRPGLNRSIACLRPAWRRPAAGRRPSGARRRSGTLRVLRARAVLHGPVRLLRLQHLHRRARPSSAPEPRGRRTPPPRSPRSGWLVGCSGTGTCRSRRSSSAAVPLPCSARPTWARCVDGDRRRVRAGSRAPRSRPRPTPTASTRPTWSQLREGGLNRISFGMQSAVDHVLKRPRPHPRPAPRARGRGLGPGGRLRAGEPGPDLRHAGGVASPTGRPSLEAALACEPDHVSAYSLIVEDGTALARRVRRGELPMPDEDDLADKYLLADERLQRRRARVVRGVQLGPRRRGPVPAQPRLLARRRLVGRRSRRALARRRGALVERQAPRGVRRPVAAGASPAQAREVLDAETRRVERVLLELRLRERPALEVLDDAGRARGRRVVATRAGRRRRRPAGAHRAGRLLADGVVRDLLP